MSSGTPRKRNVRLDDEADLAKFYTLNDNKIGKGAFGIVYKASSIKDASEIVAIKKVNKEKAGSGRIKLLEQEVSLLKEVQHENIIELFSVYETGSVLFMVFEYCESELGSYIKSQENGILNESENRTLVRQLSSAIKYLHSLSIAHRDLKMENILVKTIGIGDEKFLTKITDFGLSQKQSVGTLSGKREFLEQFCGTPVYMAPEILQKHSYSVKCDIWSLGLIIYESMSGKFAFQRENLTEDEIIEVIIKARFNYEVLGQNYPPDAIEMLKKMLHPDPARRMSAGEILDWNWVQNSNAANPVTALDMMREMLAEGSSRETLDSD